MKKIELNKVLNGLVSKQLLTTKGQGRGMKYLLSELFNEYIRNSVNNEIISVNSRANSVNNKDNSVNSDVNIVNNYDEMRSELFEISKPARERKRLSPSVIKQIIIEMCSVRPVSVKELSDFLNRNDHGIRINYITPLIEEGKICPLYEGQKNHPKQAYETVKQK